MTTNPRMARKPQPRGFSVFLLKCLLVYAALAAALVATLVGNAAAINDDSNLFSNATTRAVLYPVVTTVVATLYAATTLVLISFSLVTRCRLSAILQGFLWIERYNTQLKVRTTLLRTMMRMITIQ